MNEPDDRLARAQYETLLLCRESQRLSYRARALRHTTRDCCSTVRELASAARRGLAGLHSLRQRAVRPATAVESLRQA